MKIRHRTFGPEHLVSIGMPVYNGEPYINRALDSLLAQDYSDFELIVSDNASTDRTLDICREYAAKDRRMKIYRQSQNVGIQKNFQKVLSLARGRYFMWAAVDDYWMPQFLSTLVRELEDHPGAGVAMCAVERVLPDGTSFDVIRFLGKEDPNQMSFLGMGLALETPVKYNLFIYGLFRTRLIKSALPVPQVVCGDRRFLSQFALATRFRYVDKVLHIRTHHDKPYEDRYPLDEFAKSRLAFERRLFSFEPILVGWRILFRSKIIPWYRRLYVPVVLGYMLYNSLFSAFRAIAREIILRFFPHSLQKRLLKSVGCPNESRNIQNA